MKKILLRALRSSAAIGSTAALAAALIFSAPYAIAQFPGLLPSGYVWGNAPDLWRLWYCGGLADSERLELRNELVWDKRTIAGMKSPDLTQFPMATERCLFFQFGQQFAGCGVLHCYVPAAHRPARSRSSALPT